MYKRKEISNFSKSIMHSTGQALRKHRKSNGLTQKNVSEYLGITDETLCNYENGKVAIPFDVILVLCMKYGIKQIHFLPSLENPKQKRILEIKSAALTEIERGLTGADKKTYSRRDI